MQVESVIMESAGAFMKQLKLLGWLKHIIVDKVHQLLVACDYCDCLNSLPNIISLGVPIFGLSATLLPCSEAAYVSAMHLTGSAVYQI